MQNKQGLVKYVSSLLCILDHSVCTYSNKREREREGAAFYRVVYYVVHCDNNNLCMILDYIVY